MLPKLLFSNENIWLPKRFSIFKESKELFEKLLIWQEPRDKEDSERC